MVVDGRGHRESAEMLEMSCLDLSSGYPGVRVYVYVYVRIIWAKHLSFVFFTVYKLYSSKNYTLVKENIRCLDNLSPEP